VTTYGKDDDELGTLTDAAFLTLGATLKTIRHGRFEETGWFYGGVTTTACPSDGTMLHVFRKKYRVNDRDYLYAACVCTHCRSAVAAADLGLKTSALGLNPSLQKLPITSEPPPPGSRGQHGAPMIKTGSRAIDPSKPIVIETLEDLEVHDLLDECVESLPTERLRQILTARLGIHTDAATLQSLADHYGISRERVRKLQDHALSTLAAMALTDHNSAAHKLAVEFGVSTQPNHLAIAERVHRLVKNDAPPLARQRTILWMQMAGAGPSCSRHIANMVTEQIRATEDSGSEAGPTWGGKRASKILQAWLSDAEWPASPTIATPLAKFSPTRAVSNTEVSGSIYLAKLDREVFYESGVERQFLSMLDRAPDVKSFVEQPCAIQYDFEGPKTYHPDVLVEFVDGRLMLVEVKDIMHLVDSKNLTKYDSARSYAHSQGWGWAVCTNGNPSLTALRNRSVEPHVVQAFKEQLRLGPIKAESLRALRNETPFQYLDLLAMTLQHGWAMEHHPFCLTAY
jgi:hypothetical protein